MVSVPCTPLKGQMAIWWTSPLACSRRRQQRLPKSQISAIFERKGAPIIEPPATPPPKKWNFSFGKKAAPAPVPPPPDRKRLFGFGKKVEAPAKVKVGGGRREKKDAAKPVQRKQTFLEALDFSEVRSYEDAKLLSDAKYGVRAKDGKMSREQYNALRRKVGGTAKSFFKETVEAKGQYVEQGYVSKDAVSISDGIPGLPFLVAVVLSLFGVLGYVVSQTS